MKWPFSSGKTLFAVITAGSILAVVLLIVYRPQRPEAPPPPEQRVAVTVLPVAPVDLVDRLSLPARVEPFDDLVVSAEQAGRIMALMVEEGAPVRRGATLLQIDDRLWRAGLQRAELAARDARRDLERVRELRQTGAISQSDFEAAETRAEAAALVLEEAVIRLDQCTPTSPIDGRIEERRVSAGEYVHPGQALFRLLDTTRVRVSFDVPERDVLTLRPDAVYGFRLDALPERHFEGPLRFVTEAAQPGNNAYRAELWIDNPDGVFRPGMIARADLVRGRIDAAVVLPMRAIVPMKGESLVYVVEQDHAVRRIVRIGAVIDAQAVIRDGIAVGDRVILDGNRSVLDGTPVTIVNDWKPAPVPDAPDN